MYAYAKDDVRFTLQLEGEEKIRAQRQQKIAVQKRQNRNIQFIRKVHKCEDLTGLTPRSLRDLVNGKCRQSVHIKYDGIGSMPLEKVAERGQRDRSHAVL